MLGKIFDTASLLKAKITKDDLDQALIEATNEDNWQASTGILHQIASSAYNHQKWRKISQFIWEKLKNNKRWKKILKSLNIVEFLLKNGPIYVVNEIKYQLRFFKTMESYSVYEEGADRGASIREKSKAISALLQNQQLLEDQRVRAKQIRQRMSHLSGTSNYNSEGLNQAINIPKYESFNSQSFNTANIAEDKGYYNYGSGNYGDRQQNKEHRDDYFQHMSRQERQQNFKKQKIKPVETIQKPKTTEPIIVSTVKPQRKEEKGNYQSMAQRLMKNSPIKKTNKQVVAPDLSYKKKEYGDLLIDTEAQFTQNRYHFQPSKPNQDQKRQPVIIQNKPAQLPKPIVVIAKPQPQVVQVQANNSINTGLEGLFFLGISQQPKTESITNTVNQPAQNPQPLNNIQTKQPNQQTSIPNQQIPIPNQQIPIQTNQLPQQTPQTLTQVQPIYPNNAAIQASKQVYYNQVSPSLPIQQNYYNGNSYPGYGYPRYSQPTNYYPNSYQQNAGLYNPYSPNIPYYNPQQYNPYTVPTPAYPPQPLQSPIYQNPYQKYNKQNASNINFQPISQQPKQNATNKTQEEEFGSFTNGGAFENQKIGWLSKKQKNLTDLTDFTLNIQPKKEAEKKKEFSNNITIDPWSW